MSEMGGKRTLGLGLPNLRITPCTDEPGKWTKRAYSNDWNNCGVTAAEREQHAQHEHGYRICSREPAVSSWFICSAGVREAEYRE